MACKARIDKVNILCVIVETKYNLKIFIYFCRYFILYKNTNSTHGVMKSQGFVTKINCSNRPITDLKYNSDGDLIFVSSKSTFLTADGDPIGTYDGHEGSVFTLSISTDTTRLITGSADMSIITWGVETGESLNKIDTNCVIKKSDMIGNTKNCIVSCDTSLNKKQTVFLYDSHSNTLNPLICPNFIPTGILVDYSQTKVILSDEEGSVHILDLRNNKIISTNSIHNGAIKDISNSFCKTFFVTSSTDSLVKIVDSDTLEVKKMIACEEPINSSSIFPTNDKVVCVGGMSARDVTVSEGKTSFDTSFYDIITCERVGFYSSHYGTINCVDVRPDCRGYCSAGEEGTVSIVEFGEDFYNAPFTKFE